MSPLAGSVLLSLASAVCYASAAIMQERIAATTAPSRLGLLRSGRWWSAVLLQGAGALLHVIALGLGPLTVVQPLGVLTLVLAAPMAAVLLQRPVGRAAWRGIALVSTGLAGILLLTGDHGKGSLGGGGQLVLGAAVLGTVTLLVCLAGLVRRTSHSPRGPAVRSVALAMAAGVAYGAASVFVKALAENWTSSSLAAALPLLAVIAVLAAAGLSASQASYRGGGLAAPLATATVANPVVAATAGIVLLGEGFRYGLPGALLASAAGLAAAWGLVVLTFDSAGRRRGPGGGPGDGELPAVVIPSPEGAGRRRHTKRRPAVTS